MNRMHCHLESYGEKLESKGWYIAQSHQSTHSQLWERITESWYPDVICLGKLAKKSKGWYIAQSHQSTHSQLWERITESWHPDVICLDPIIKYQED
ncbi:unnamed protein product [Clavelina lepadiformis]|uniref:Uncharacterized protein n=1 Tax=Clavelina lepadiformis TaxID=159417 RepID=A0ABP0EXM3_CLALP